jgi:hypothetical protein
MSSRPSASFNRTPFADATGSDGNAAGNVP